MSTNPAVAELAKKLGRQEQVSVPGADMLTPKQSLLDAREVQKKNPDLRVRWVSLRNPEKLQARQAEGYQALTPEQGGRRLGDNLVLMGIPRERHEARVARQERANQERLKQHNRDMEAIVEAVARELRDKHGISVKPERILVQEG